MIITLLLFSLAQSLYLLEKRQNNILINLDNSQKAIISLSIPASIIQDENTYQYCPYYQSACWIEVANDNINAIDNVQLKVNNIQIYDDEEHSYNTEFIVFLHLNMEMQINDYQNNYITLNPLASFFNSFVYFGYSFCISESDAYLKIRQNEFLEKNKQNLIGIKSEVYQNNKNSSTTYSIRISYFECFDQVFDISNYSINILDDVEYIIFPIELMQRISILAHIYQFQEISLNDQFDGLFRETKMFRIEPLSSIKFYNVIEQPLFIMPEDFIFYNYKNQGIDILKLAGDKLESEIVLGSSFLKNKIVHFSSLTNQFFIEQFEGAGCHKQMFQKDVFTYLDIIKVIILIIILIFVYAIFRRLRVQYLLKSQKKRVDQQLILTPEAMALK